MNIRKEIIERFSVYILPLLLGSAVAYDVIKCYYYEKCWQYTALYFVVAALLFILFDWIKKHKFIGALIYTVMFVAAAYLAGYFTRMGYYHSGVWFVNWFYLNRDNAGFVIEYFYALMLFGGFFLSSIIYYFTIVRYRSLGSMLCVLFPFVICAKRADSMSELQIAVLITLFLAVLVHNRQNLNGKRDVKVVVNLSYVISIALFVSFVGAVAMVVPRPEVRSVLESDATAFDLNAADTDDAIADYTSYSETSSPRFGASYTNEILFYFESDQELPVYYLKRQNYNDFYDDRWHAEDVTARYTGFDYYRLAKNSRKDMYDSMRSLAATGKYEKYGLTEDLFTAASPELHTFRVYDDDFNGYYIPAPAGTVAQTYKDSFRDNFYTIGDGEVVVKYFDADYDYTLSYYPETDEYVDYAGSLSLNGDDYFAMLNEAVENGDLPDNNLLEEYGYVINNFTGGVEYSQEMYDLAQEIIVDCNTDFEKAMALSDYFEENDYVYDLEYIPEDESIDYFLFESKTGSCTSYATAMTIMARLCGLPARYVEGFAGYERSEDGSVVIRDSHAHAFVEVYINGAGWITFDPTVPGYMADYSQSGGFNFALFAQYLSRILVFLGVIFFVVFILLLDRIVEFIFRVYMKFVKGDKRIVRLYRHIIKLLEFSSREDLSAYTPDMLTAYAADNRAIDVEPIARLFEKTCFGGIALSDKEFKDAYQLYRSVYKYLRKLPKPQAADSVNAGAV